MVIQYEDGKEDEVIEGDRFIIATGAKSQTPKVKGLEETGYITSENFFGEQYPEKPWESLAIIGSGAISLEFAHIFSAFGTKVTMIARSERILKKEDIDIAEFVEKQFRSNDIDILTESDIVSVTKEGALKVITIENRNTKEKKVIRCEEILVASGSRTTTDDLALDKAGVEMDKAGWITTNEYLETNQPNIWAIGDINGKYQFRHKANHEAQVLANNILGDKDKKKVNYYATPWAIFTHPQVGRVGDTEQELKDQGIPYLTAKNYYSEVVGGRAMGFKTGDEDNGFVKVLLGKDKRILGVHVVGPQAAALVQPFVYLMNMELKSDLSAYDIIDDSMIIHPSLSELTAWVLGKIEF
jgi:mycothione reductase